MNKSYLLAAIIFIVIGIVYSGFGFYLSFTGKEKKSSFNLVSGRFFSLIGALAAISGILGIIYIDFLTPSAVLISSIIFLLAMTVLLFVFSMSVKKDDDNNSE